MAPYRLHQGKNETTLLDHYFANHIESQEDILQPFLPFYLLDSDKNEQNYLKDLDGKEQKKEEGYEIPLVLHYDIRLQLFQKDSRTSLESLYY